MSTIRGTFYTDVHLQDKNPASRKGSYLDDIMAKLEYIGEFSMENKADFIICGGDLFNHKVPNRNSYSMVNRVIDLFARWKGPLNLITEGNHDITNDRVDSLDDQPLGNVLRSGTISHLRKSVVDKRGLVVNIQGYDFTEKPDFKSLTLREEDRADVNILVLHAYAGPEESDLFGTKIFGYPEISETGHDIYLFGHYHKYQGISKLESGGRTQYFVNLGSVSRGDYGDTNLKRVPKFCYLEISKKSAQSPASIVLKEIDIPCRPGDDVFDVEQKVRENEQLEEAKKFVEELQISSLTEDEEEGADTKHIEKALESLEISKDVMDCVQGYLKDAAEQIGVPR